jgi:hypothetical protein
MWTVLVLLLPLGQAQAIVLNNWNDADLNASGDVIDIKIGKIDGDSFFAMKWRAGTDNTLSAIGIDQVYYNCEGCGFTSRPGDDAGTPGGVKAVWEGAIGGDDVTSKWQTNKGGETAGGGFGDFNSRKNQNGGTRAGVDDWLIFVLNGMVDFTGPPTFAAHVRYEEDCSGWVSDGATKESESGSCGASIPEPATAWLIGLGLGLIGFARLKA